MPELLPPALQPTRIMFDLEVMSRGAGMSITGGEQVVASNAGRWIASMSFPAVDEDAVLAVRGLRAALAGRAGEIEIGPFDAYAPADMNGRRLSPVAATLISGGRNDVPFHDGAGFAQGDETHATLAADANLRATRITIAPAPSWTIPRPGQYFGIGARLYIATRSYRATDADPWTIEFRPTLREPAAAGARVITDRPVCTMRLASDDSGQLDLRLRRYASVTLELVEAI